MSIVGGLDIQVIGKLSAQHRAVYFRDFLGEIDRQAEPGLAVHVICDNLSAHKAPAVHRWLLAHPRGVLHFTPTYWSWFNQVPVNLIGAICCRVLSPMAQPDAEVAAAV